MRHLPASKNIKKISLPCPCRSWLSQVELQVIISFQIYHTKGIILFSIFPLLYAISVVTYKELSQRNK